MVVKDWYELAIENKADSLLFLLDFLIFEKEKLKMDDPEERLHFMMKEEFRPQVDKALLIYKKRLEAKNGGMTG
jgi:hypothetical protein